jgi:hypothetical protein
MLLCSSGVRAPARFRCETSSGGSARWITNESGSYERVYMGATYRFNPEDATAICMLPVTDADYLVQEITARCVADPTGF